MHGWSIVWQWIGFPVFLIASTAEINRTPFDMVEADSEIVAGFATEYSGMRFGFFFFAEYVNVFVLSAIITTLFLGGWSSGIGLALPIELNLDLGSWGIALLLVMAAAPVVLTLLFAIPFLLARSSMPAWQALLLGFIAFNVVAVGLLFGVGYIALPWVAGLVFFLVKTFILVFVFVWMRGTLPRVRIDQLMGFAWKWLLPASLLNLFVTAAALVVLR
jgi:NADH-quinone oxidoreductase subunit H